MAKDRSQKKGKDKWKEKTWYTLVAPDYLGGREIGMSIGNGETNMAGRKIEIPVSDFTGNFRRANAKMSFRILSCQGTKCSTEFIGHSLSDDYIRRMVRRRKERIDIIKNVSTSDHANMVLKVVIVTDGKLNTSKRTEIRKTVENFLVEKANTVPYGDLVKYVIGEDVYGDIINATKDIYPIKKIEMRKSVLSELSASPQPKTIPVEASVEQVS
ncbi:MAG: 30S ribosomal protein S3ae [Candidatus Thermoplasmatota archaeon]|nr:30S ribosomal protein S3ae [Candidatus Thermoplasmatota archaeon]MCL6091247.1 30S ribosomal protein S3ae [Candidatus Thermoplasmatota archaeon]MDA8143002.1 30S ribosomal protein S3ae [Thermoplasmatales archaeon]